MTQVDFVSGDGAGDMGNDILFRMVLAASYGRVVANSRAVSNNSLGRRKGEEIRQEESKKRKGKKQKRRKMFR